MLPREAYERYGGPQANDFNTSAVLNPILSVAPERYSILFICATGGTYAAAPIVGAATVGAFITVSPTAPLFLSYALYGAMVQTGWVVAQIGAPIAGRVIHCYAMADVARHLAGVPDVQAGADIYGVGGRGVNPGAPDQSGAQIPDNLGTRGRARVIRLRPGRGP